MKLKTLLLCAAAVSTMGAAAQTAATDQLYIDDISIERGKTVEADLILNNATGYSAIDAVFLLEGAGEKLQFTEIYDDYNEENALAYVLSDGRARRHALASQLQWYFQGWDSEDATEHYGQPAAYYQNYIDADGNLTDASGRIDMPQHIKIVLSNMQNREIAAGEGAIAKIGVKAAEDLEAGEYVVASPYAKLANVDDALSGNPAVVTKTVTVTTSGVSNANVNKTVKSVKYYNLAGQESNEAFEGVNVMVKTYTDGTTGVEKVIK